MTLEPTTYDKLKPGDLFFYPADLHFTRRMEGGVQVLAHDPEPGNIANVVRIVCECEERPEP